VSTFFWCQIYWVSRQNPSARTVGKGHGVLSHLDQSDDDNVELKIKTKVNSNCKKL
jgi:hypothetical protein